MAYRLEEEKAAGWEQIIIGGEDRWRPVSGSVLLTTVETTGSNEQGLAPLDGGGVVEDAKKQGSGGHSDKMVEEVIESGNVSHVMWLGETDNDDDEMSGFLDEEEEE